VIEQQPQALVIPNPLVAVIPTNDVPVPMHLPSVDGQQPLVIPNPPNVISTNNVSVQQQQQVIMGRQNTSQRNLRILLYHQLRISFIVL
jgi:hypothetical protein